MSKRHSQNIRSIRRQKEDPVGVYRFLVVIDNLEAGGFSEVSGLDAEIETEQVIEGGVNNVVHHLPKRIKYGRLVLKKGICHNRAMVDWFDECKNGNIKKRNITISLNDSTNSNVCTWDFVEAFPVKFAGPQLVAQNSNGIAIENIEFEYRELIYNKDYYGIQGLYGG